MSNPQSLVRKHRSLAEKRSLIAEIERRMKAEGRGVKPVASQLGIAVSTYYMWLREVARPAPAPSVYAQAVVAPLEPAPTRAGGSYGAAERARILAAVRAGLAAGIAIKVTARQYGITPGVFYRWAREAGRDSLRSPAPENMRSQALVVSVPQAPAFRSVTLTGPEPVRVALSLVAPSGHRVEGLSVETAAALLRALS